MFNIQITWSQAGIGTISPDPGVVLDVIGAVQIKDGTEGEDNSVPKSFLINIEKVDNRIL